MNRSKVNIPVSDYFTSLKVIINNNWQIMWNNEQDHNKLKQIKPNVGFWHSSLQKERHMEVILTRLRIGHSHLTHGFLMNTPHDSVPLCNHCRCILTIKHILCECPNFNRQRMLSIGNKSLQEILSESPTFSIHPIIKFLKSTSLLGKI